MGDVWAKSVVPRDLDVFLGIHESYNLNERRLKNLDDHHKIKLKRALISQRMTSYAAGNRQQHNLRRVSSVISTKKEDHHPARKSMYLSKVDLSKASSLDEHVAALSACLGGVNIDDSRPEWGSPIVNRSSYQAMPATPQAEPFIVDADEVEAETEHSRSKPQEATHAEIAEMRGEFEKLQQLVLDGRMTMEQYTDIVCASVLDCELVPLSSVPAPPPDSFA